MPFDIGFSELLVIGIVALIVIGPRDLPGLFRTLGRFTGKMRGMAREFSRAMEAAADEAGVKDVGKDLKGMTSSKNLGLDKLNEAAAKFESWDPKRAPKTGDAERAAKAKKGPETQKLADEKAAKSAALKEDVSKKKAAKAPVEDPAAPDEKTDPAA